MACLSFKAYDLIVGLLFFRANHSHFQLSKEKQENLWRLDLLSVRLLTLTGLPV